MTQASRLVVFLISSLTLALSSALSGCSSSDISSDPPLDGPLDAQEDINVTSEAIRTAPVCVDIRRGVLGDVADTQIASNHPNKNYGSNTVARAGKINGGIHQTLLRFDLSAVPSGALVTSARLTLTQTDDGSALVEVHRVTTPWQEDTVTWNSLAGSFTSPGSVFFDDGPGAKVSVDVTFQVMAWVNGATPNHGFLLAHDGRHSTSFATSEVAEVRDRPRLQVCFILPGAPRDLPDGRAAALR